MTPQAVKVGGDGLVLQWPDGVSALSAPRLRAACRCGGCRAAQLAGQPAEPRPELRLSDAAAVGAYALQLSFSDGHDRGIYPWVYLRELGAGTG
ncbi:DUF971 domain-containing protein [Aquabacterium sp. A7-Y]|uniref:DUF971 domain-containing protein n=1 Tax=Aquabacterium sp. A7-Y TaxID=1349605 RepID=UPI00223D732A|nr:DUF971 domain-containing protein [Aquabacterium sp. A7-Y]MCW7540194.1 DUF971 domain-containing protein [Aquabacterium sp. A7-Y]